MFSTIKAFFQSIFKSVDKQIHAIVMGEEETSRLNVVFIDEQNNKTTASIAYEDFSLKPLLLRYDVETGIIELNQGPHSVELNYNILKSIEDIVMDVDLKHY